MSEYHLTRAKTSLGDLFQSLEGELEANPEIIVTTQTPGIGKWGMTQIWRIWMASTAKWMAAQGCTMPLMYKPDGTPYGKRPFDSNDAHEMFCREYLGVDDEGRRLSWSKNGRGGVRAATKGERFDAMRKHKEWAMHKGIQLLKPRNSEYEQLEREQQQ